MLSVRRFPYVIVGALLGFAAMPALAGPQLELSQESWNFGKVWHPEQPSMQLVVSNAGDAELKLTRVKSTCGCTTVDPSKTALAPGESTSIPIRFITRGKQGDVGSKVIIESNDPQRPRVEFKISGYVNRAIRREPIGGLVIRTLDGSPGQTGTLRLVNQMSKPMELKLRSNNIPFLDVQLREVSPGLEYQLIGRTTKRLDPGVTSGAILLETNLEREPRFTVMTRVIIVPVVDPSPSAIFVPDRKTTTHPRTVMVKYFGDHQPFKITKVECKERELPAQIYPASTPRNWSATPKPTAMARVIVQVPGANDIPEEGLHLVLHTNDPEHPTADLLITANQSDFQRIIYGTVSAQ